MKRRFGQFLLIIMLNLGILLVMLFYWTGNCLRMQLGQNHSRLFELFELSGLLLLAFIALAFVGKIAEHIQLAKDPLKNQLRIVFLLIFLIFGLKYVKYTVKSVSILKNKTVITQLCPKIELLKLDGEREGITVKDISFREYDLIRKIKDLPTITKNSTSITVFQTTTVFTKYYEIRLIYKVPVDEKIPLIDMDNGHFRKSQSFKIEEHHKIVEYIESLL